MDSIQKNTTTTLVGKQQIVFYMEKDQTIAGSLIFMLKLATFLAETNSFYEVYYVNHLNKDLIDRYRSEKVTYLDINDCDFSQFENAYYFVPLNYLFFFLNRARKSKGGKVLLFNWHPNMAEWLSKQFPRSFEDTHALYEYLSSKKCVASMDRVTEQSFEQITGVSFDTCIVPIFPALEPQTLKRHTFTNAKEINFGWLGRLDTDKVYSLVNLCDCLASLHNDQVFSIHIIGDGNAVSKLTSRKYPSNIKLIFNSYMTGSERDTYLVENVDIVLAMGMSALDAAQLSLPTLLPIVTNTSLATNSFLWIYDSEGFSLTLGNKNSISKNNKIIQISEAIDLVINKRQGSIIGEKCEQYVKENFNIARSASLLMDAFDHSKLYVEDCFGYTPINEQLFRLSQYIKKEGSDTLDMVKYTQFVSDKRKPPIKRAYRLVKKRLSWLLPK